jgi:hypothetical protein
LYIIIGINIGAGTGTVVGINIGVSTGTGHVAVIGIIAHTSADIISTNRAGTVTGAVGIYQTFAVVSGLIN